MKPKILLLWIPALVSMLAFVACTPNANPSHESGARSWSTDLSISWIRTANPSGNSDFRPAMEVYEMRNQSKQKVFYRGSDKESPWWIREVLIEGNLQRSIYGPVCGTGVEVYALRAGATQRFWVRVAKQERSLKTRVGVMFFTPRDGDPILIQSALHSLK